MIYYNGNENYPLQSISLLSGLIDNHTEKDIQKVELYFRGNYTLIWQKSNKLWITYLTQDGNTESRGYDLSVFDPVDDDTSLQIADIDEDGNYHLNQKFGSVIRGDLNNLVKIEDGTHKIKKLLPYVDNSGVTLASNNLEVASFPGLTCLQRYIFNKCYKLTTAELSNLQTLGGTVVHFSNTNLKNLDIANDSLMTITNGFEENKCIIIKTPLYKKGQVSIVATLPGQISRISNDNITNIDGWSLNSLGDTLKDLYAINLSSVNAASFSGTNKISNLVVENSKYQSIDNGYGYRTLVITPPLSDSDRVSFVISPPNASINSEISCDNIVGINDGAAFSQMSFSKVHFNKDVFKHYDDGALLTKDNDTQLFFVSRSKNVQSIINQLSNSLSSIGGSALASSKVGYLNLPNVKTVNTWAFYDSNLISINLPSCTKMFSNVFQAMWYNTSLKDKTVGVQYVNLSSLETASQAMFQSTAFRYSECFPIMTSLKTTEYRSFSGTKIVDTSHGEYFIVEKHMPNLITIGSNTFENNKFLSSLTFPSVTSLGGKSFLQCTNIEFVNFQNCKTVGNSAFEYCTRMTSCYIPKCSSFGTGIFTDCSSMAYLDCSSKTVEEMNNLTSNIAIRKECHIKCKDGYIQNGEKHFGHTLVSINGEFHDIFEDNGGYLSVFDYAGEVSSEFSNGHDTLTTTTYSNVSSYALEGIFCDTHEYGTRWTTLTEDTTLNWSRSCFLKGTKILLADGLTEKNVEDITYEDSLACWNFDEGKLTSAKPLWIKIPQKGDYYFKNVLNSGKTLYTTGKSKTGYGHRMFDVSKGSFIYTPESVGDMIYTLDGEEKHESCERIEGECEFYNIITFKHINLFANKILTSCSMNNIYPIKDMKFVKDNRMPRNEKEFWNIPTSYIEGLRLREQTMPLSDIIPYVRNLQCLEVQGDM